MCQHFRVCHRLISPRTARLNGKVERSQQMDVKKFYRLRPCRVRQDLQQGFACWLWRYNHTGLHMVPYGKTPIQVLRSFPQYAHIKN